MLQVGFETVPQHATPQDGPLAAPFRGLVGHLGQCWRHYKHKLENNGYYHGSKKTGAPPEDYQHISTDLMKLLQTPGQLPDGFWLEHSHTTARMAVHRKLEGRDETFIYHL
mmetsp:Transcript_13890/g.26841  ORF Transcript_13890/g.26841 Transcript_13890/m.26841 type:complete len:111 (+) Transcript_13890:267-599(+)